MLGKVSYYYHFGNVIGQPHQLPLFYIRDNIVLCNVIQQKADSEALLPLGHFVKQCHLQ